MNTLKVQYIVDDEGKKTAVILLFEQYRQLLEDLHDLAVVAERRDEKPVDMIDEKMKRVNNLWTQLP